MPTDKERLFNAKVGAQLYLQAYPEITPETIKQAVEAICSLPMYQGIPEEQLIDLLEKENNIFFGSTEAILEDRENHIPWLYESGRSISEGRDEITWKFWTDYKQNLLQKGWAPKVIDTIDEMSAKILMRLEDPLREGPWWRKGMVVGDVQSGKTANYTALICKAADAGYRLIVVFAGLHNSLRSQTQQRLDDDFIGFDSDRDDRTLNATNRIGVGKFFQHPVVHYVTTSNENGDFSRAHANQVGLNPAGSDPIILIIKKNVSIIRNLHNWADRMGRIDGQDKIKNIPLMVIDDECDNASVDTGLPETDEDGHIIADYEPKAINRGIRGFINLFEQSTYVGYTATPFANILILQDGHHPVYGEDLFPRHFIINLPVPSNYIGPEKVFGIEEDPDLGVEGTEGYPLCRVIEDYAAYIPNKHKKDLVIRELPDSLRKAIRAFILSCAARRVRSQTHDHNSMLIHVTRFVFVQQQIAELVNEEKRSLWDRLRYGDGASRDNIWEELREFWEEDFVRGTSSQMGDLGLVHSWEEVKMEILPAAEKIHVRQINGQSGDILEYKTYRDSGINVIAVGGDKLSRGLTLEGLTISYYLRCSRMYDTLMQMGRWFGYRPGYLDLCRIYTTEELISWYRYIALASLELRGEFDYMVENDEIPDNYGLKIRSHPGVLSVTSCGKMRHGRKMKITFNGHMAQTLTIYNSPEQVENNFSAVERLISGKSYSEIKRGYQFSGISPGEIQTFLEHYHTHPANLSFRPTQLIQYIEKMNQERELIDWTVIVISRQDGPPAGRKLHGIEAGLKLTKRTATEVTGEYIRYAKALLSKADELLDLNEQEMKKLAGKIVARGGIKEPTPQMIRSCRAPERGLLLLYPVCGNLNRDPAVSYGDGEVPVFGYVMSFPESRVKRNLEYVVNSVHPDEG